MQIFQGYKKTGSSSIELKIQAKKNRLKKIHISHFTTLLQKFGVYQYWFARITKFLVKIEKLVPTLKFLDMHIQKFQWWDQFGNLNKKFLNSENN